MKRGTKLTKAVKDAGKTLRSKGASKRDKELAAKVLSDRAHGVKRVGR